ncbi:MAG: hypothetical protein CXT69_03555 [Methanobacteriota archaeon]|nr:MAG: hypothetical protein CXT69_03555 [Euryarchaeota archaeon]HIK79150.1 ABC transporter ATP-binding protein [Candidatus Poseidoniales archaeon]
MSIDKGEDAGAAMGEDVGESQSKVSHNPLLHLQGIGFRYRIPPQNPILFWRHRFGPGVHDIDLQLESGQIVGLVGPNGAGKTTLMEILAGIIPPSSGQILIAGHIALSAGELPRGNSQIGFMPEQVRWSGPGSPRSALTWVSTLRGSQSDVQKLLNLVGLKNRADDPLDNLSQGMRQRLSMACALLGKPQILILDEPMNGLDPVAQTAFRNLLHQLAKKGHTILVSSHMLAELEDFVDRIVVMHRGQIIAEGTMNELEESLELGIKYKFKGIGKLPEKILSSYLSQIETLGCPSGEWAITASLSQPHNSKKSKYNSQNLLISKMVEELSISGTPPYLVEVSHHNLSSILAAATGMESSEIGLELDEHVMIPLALKSSPTYYEDGGEEE